MGLTGQNLPLPTRLPIYVTCTKANPYQDIRWLCPAAGIKKGRPRRTNKKCDAAKPSYGRVSVRYNPIILGR